MSNGGFLLPYLTNDRHGGDGNGGRKVLSSRLFRIYNTYILWSLQNGS